VSLPDLRLFPGRGTFTAQAGLPPSLRHRLAAADEFTCCIEVTGAVRDRLTVAETSR
jgi:hypothetical protein